MIKRLEQVAALVVAAGLAIVSYWLFFSWAQGGGVDHRRPQPRQGERSQLGVPFPAGARIAVAGGAVSPPDGAGGGRSARLEPRPALPLA